MVEIIKNETPKQAEGNKAHVVVLLDESGSMSGHRSEVVTTFNEYVESVKDTAEKVSLYTFDSTGIREKFREVPIAEVRKITEDDYSPGAMTPLYDAMGKVINEFLSGSSIQFVTHTDGHENHSVEWDYNALKALIDARTKSGWLFVYLGEGVDGKRQMSQFQGVKMQFSSANRAKAMRGLGETTALYSATGETSLSAYTNNLSGEIDVDKDEKVKRRTA